MTRGQPALSLLTGSGMSYSGQWAGCLVETDFPAPGLAITRGVSAFAAPENPGPATSHVATTGFLAGEVRNFNCAWHGQDALLEISGIGRLRVGLDEGRAQFLEPPTDTAAAVLTLTGPCLALLMAARGRFMLHGSAARSGDGATILLGSSGAGKSTLAGAADARTPGSRIADDLVVCEDTRSGPSVAGPLPQPRIPEAYVQHPRLPIRRLVLLAPTGAAPRLVRVSRGDMALALVRHTVAARLFSPVQLVDHLAWSSRMADADLGWALSYRQVPDNLQSMVDLITTA